MRGQAAIIACLLVAPLAGSARGAEDPSVPQPAEAAASAADPSLNGGYPEELNLPFGESLVLPLPVSASFILSDGRAVSGVRVKDGVELKAHGRGAAMLFVFDGEVNASITVRVGDPVPRYSLAPRQVFVSDPASDDEEQRFLTGGFIDKGLLAYTSSASASGSGRFQSLTGSLGGSTPDFTYQLMASRISTQTDQTNLTGSAIWHWGLANFSPGIRQTEFMPVANIGLQPYRDAYLRTFNGGLVFEGDARAPLTYDHFSFAPTAVRGMVSDQVGPASVGLGAIAAGLDGPSRHWLPFATLGGSAGKFSASVTGGVVPGLDARIGAASASLGIGSCALTGQYTTGLRGRDAAKVRTELRAYVDPGQDALSAQGRCSAGQFFFGARASRGGQSTTLFDAREVLLTSFAGWSGRTPGDAVMMNVSWATSSGADFRDQAQIYGSKRLGDYEFTLSASALRPMGNWMFDESVMARRLFGGLSSVGVSAGTSHELSAPQMGWASLDARFGSPTLLATASLQSEFARYARPSWMGQLLLSWALLTNYSMTAATSVDLQQYRNWNITFGISYAFGDSVPREPALAAFRSSSLEAFAFEDLDGNGTWESGEPPLAGITVCVDREACSVTNETGRFIATRLADGKHRVRVDGTAVQGALPTGDLEATVAVGSFSRPVRRFGFRRSGEIVVHAYVDSNGNGVRDPGEEELRVGHVQIAGPEVDTTVALGPHARTPFYKTGDFLLRYDLMSLPAGYAGPDVNLAIDAFRRFDVDVPLRPLRSVEGRICLSDERGVCLERALPLPPIHVRVDGHDGVSNEAGMFLLSGLPGGPQAVRLTEADLPAGLRPAKTVVADLAMGPQRLKLAIPVVADPAAGRAEPVEIAWPGEGRFRARQVGGYFFSPEPSHLEGPPDRTDERNLRKLAQRAKKLAARVALAVYADKAEFAADPAKALDRARTTGAALVRSLFPGVAPDRIKLEAREPLGSGLVVEILLLLPLPATS